MQKTAKCAVFMGHNLPFDIRNFPVTPPPKGYGASRLLASGVCGTVLHIHSGRLGGDPETIIGHEFVGQLVGCDPDEAVAYGLKIGDNVIADIAVPAENAPSAWPVTTPTAYGCSAPTRSTWIMRPICSAAMRK